MREEPQPHEEDHGHPDRDGKENPRIVPDEPRFVRVSLHSTCPASHRRKKYVMALAMREEVLPNPRRSSITTGTWTKATRIT